MTDRRRPLGRQDSNAVRKKALVRVALALVLQLTTPALAEEPKGFGQFPWGTGFDEVNEKFFGPRCGGMLPVPDDHRPMCSRYELEGIGTVVVGLDFTSGTLQGYAISVPFPKVHDSNSPLCPSSASRPHAQALG